MQVVFSIIDPSQFWNLKLKELSWFFGSYGSYVLICKQYTLLHWKFKCTECIVIYSVISLAKKRTTTISFVASVWFINMCNKVCHTVRENALMMNCSLNLMHRPSFLIFSLTIKDKTNISLTFKTLHLRQGSATHNVRTIFTLKLS